MTANGFTNSFTSGEISDDAWDRVELQPVAKGCEQALNYIIRVPGPLGKRRGFWDVGSVNDPTKAVRAIPFRKGLASAFFLEFGDEVAWVWQINGAPLMSGPDQVSFATPWTVAQIPGLRYKQVADVIYFTHAEGLPPQQLAHKSDMSWTFSLTSFVNGPWLAENTILTDTITVAGTSIDDFGGGGGIATDAGVMVVGTDVTLTASGDLFVSGHVGASLKLRATSTSPAVNSWLPAASIFTGEFLVFNGNIYGAKMSVSAGTGIGTGTTPPVHTSGIASDGKNPMTWLHDGSGVVVIDTVSSPTSATGHVVKSVPLKDGTATSFYAFGAYGPLQGWPTSWPAMREERLVMGAPQGTQDFLDLTQTAGFNPTSVDFTPGLGTGAVVDTNAIRERIGDDSSKILWAFTATYLLVGTETGQFLVAGSVLDEPLSPAAVTIKELSYFGCADVYPAKAHKGLLYVAGGGQTLREINIDTQQGATGEDHSYLATHIASLGFAQLAWVKDPDNTLWLRLGDTSLAAFVYHQEQGVKGFTRQQLGGGFICEDAIVLPTPGGLDTVWMVVSRTVAGVVQRRIWRQSLVADKLFMDGAQFYAGDAVSELGNLVYGAGLPITAVCNGAWIPDQVVNGSGIIAVPGTTTFAQVGYMYPTYFKSLKLDLRVFNGALLQRQRIAAAIVDIACAKATVSGDDGPGELITTRTMADVETFSGHRITKEVAVSRNDDPDGSDRDPRIVIQELTPFDCVLYAIKPNAVQAGA